MHRFSFFFQAEDGIRDIGVTGVQTCALPIFSPIYFNMDDSRLFGLLIFLNTTQHKLIDIHTTSAPLSRGKLFDGPYDPAGRSEERRVGKECRSRWSPYH